MLLSNRRHETLLASLPLLTHTHTLNCKFSSITSSKLSMSRLQQGHTSISPQHRKQRQSRQRRGNRVRQRQRLRRRGYSKSFALLAPTHVDHAILTRSQSKIDSNSEILCHISATPQQDQSGGCRAGGLSIRPYCNGQGQPGSSCILFIARRGRRQWRALSKATYSRAIAMAGWYEGRCRVHFWSALRGSRESSSPPAEIHRERS